MPAPTLRRRRLAAELRQLRADRRLTLDEVAIAVDLAKSTLSRIETGQLAARPVVVRALLAAYGITGADAEALLRQAREAGRRGWWYAYRDVLPDQYVDYIALETDASAIRQYEPRFVPGLLQTEAYARRVFQAMIPPLAGDEVSRQVAVRARRQQRLSAERPLELSAVIDEAALRRPIGPPDLMAEQIDRIVAVAARQNVTIQVLPSAVGAHPGMLGAFSVITLPDPSGYDVVYVEGMGGARFLEEAVEVRHGGLVIERLRALALDPDASLALLADIRAAA